MNDEIRVHVVDRGRKIFYMRYRDPLTDTAVERSTGVSRKTEAIKVAAKWEHDLREGRYQSPSKITWDECRRRYEDEHLASLTDNNFRTVTTILNSFERVMQPKRLRGITRDVLSRYQEELRNQNLAESTIKGRLLILRLLMTHLQARGLRLVGSNGNICVIIYLSLNSPRTSCVELGTRNGDGYVSSKDSENQEGEEL